MQHTLIVRLVDITLLLLLSLMAIASIDPFAVEPPRSEAIEERGRDAAATASCHHGRRDHPGP